MPRVSFESVFGEAPLSDTEESLAVHHSCFSPEARKAQRVLRPGAMLKQQRRPGSSRKAEVRVTRARVGVCVLPGV